MYFFRALCFSIRTGLVVSAQNKCGHRGFCSKVETFRELTRSGAVQKYFDRLQSGGLAGGEISRGEVRFFVEQLFEERKEILSSLRSLVDLKKSVDEDVEFGKMLDVERAELDEKLAEVEFKLLDALAPQLPNSDEVIVEVSAGVGGKEAMLFAGELHAMYLGYIGYKNWNVAYEDVDVPEIGGVRHSTIFVEGSSVLSHFRHEAGVHRVQRVPATEKNGRIHTSTVTVAVLPQPREIDVNLNEKDLIIETKRSSGAGGQHVNKTESAVRMTHIPSGIVVECQTERSQIKNRQIAKQKLCAKLFTLQQKEQVNSIHQSRKMQVGTSARSDKIRTYNYPQDRVTDHRISRHFHNLPGFLQGEEQLDSLLNELISFSEKERLESFVLSLSDERQTAS